MTSKSSLSPEQEELFRIRHSAAHVMAQAVLELFPTAKIAIGPPIEDGFYYDFDLPRRLTPEDLETIERRMKEIMRGNFKFDCRAVTAEEARRLFADQPYKLELIDDLTHESGNGAGAHPQLTTYRQDTFEDLCRGPHVANTGLINPDAVKITSVAGAYWRGDEHRPMLQRIYATAWKTQQQLEEYLRRIEQARQRDHRKLGKQLDLFSTSDAVGPGLILWHPKGAMVRYLAERFSQEAHLLNGYQWVYTPHLGKAGLWKTSGHLDFYADSMFSPMRVEEQDYFVKPMNCPFHAEIYKSRPRSYRELPVRFAEFGTVYRYERSGVLHGLTRVRGFTQDDAHIFCRPEQMGDEVAFALRFSLYVLRSFGLGNFTAFLSTRPEGKSIGSSDDWDRATEKLRNALELEKLDYEVDEGGGAFYGPKIDVKLNDTLGRPWQLSTIQFDFNEPERFDLTFVGEDGKDHRPYMVHRALFGSVERFFALLLENYGGEFPFWLSPTQVSIIPISNHQLEYASQVAGELSRQNIRVHIDDRDERMQAKIRDFELEKTPYALVLGKKEAAANTVSLRSRDRGDQGAMTLERFFELIAGEQEQGKPQKIS